MQGQLNLICGHWNQEGVFEEITDLQHQEEDY